MTKRCPRCNGELVAVAEVNAKIDDDEKGRAICPKGHRFPVRRFMRGPRGTTEFSLGDELVAEEAFPTR